MASSVSEVLSADVPPSHRGLVKKQVEQDPGHGQEVVQHPAILVWNPVWEPLTPSPRAQYLEGQDAGSSGLPEAEGRLWHLAWGLFLPQNVHEMISTSIFLGTYHVSGTVLEAGYTTQNPTNGLWPSWLSRGDSRGGERW